MTRVQKICEYLDQLAPSELAEAWDNTGLLIGDPDTDVTRLMTCLTITPESAAEAVERGAQLIVAHHPLPFRPLTRITTATTAGRLVWQLARAGIAVYSAHTRFDSTLTGINQQLAARIGLRDLRPLTPSPDQPALGTGRIGELPTEMPLQLFVEGLKPALDLRQIDVAGRLDTPVRSIAVACGSGGSLLDAACAAGCDTFLTGESNFHTALECRARDVSLVLVGHYASERFAMEQLALELAATFPQVTAWPSRRESDPITRL